MTRYRVLAKVPTVQHRVLQWWEKLGNTARYIFSKLFTANTPSYSLRMSPSTSAELGLLLYTQPSIFGFIHTVFTCQTIFPATWATLTTSSPSKLNLPPYHLHTHPLHTYYSLVRRRTFLSYSLQLVVLLLLLLVI